MEKPNKVAAIIVAAGEGIRMGTAERKQYAMLGDRPVLAHSLCAFEKCDAIDEIFLVIPEGQGQFCQNEIVGPLTLMKPLRLVSGGPTRQDSVFNGLKATDGRFHLVVIHDGVRPFVRTEQIAHCVEVAEKYGGCIPAIEPTETIKTVNQEERVVVTLRRHLLRLAQTPQTFDYNVVLGAHRAAQEADYVGTDDAELVEKYGGVVKVIPGDPHNIKITTPEDLKIAEALLMPRSAE